MLCLCVSDLILQASAKDQIVILHFTILHQLQVFGLAFDGLHLIHHPADPGAQRQLGLILITVAVTVEEQILQSILHCYEKSSQKDICVFHCKRF